MNSEKPVIIIITGRGGRLANQFISRVLKNNFKIGRDVLIFERKEGEIKKIGFPPGKQPKTILVVTGLSNISYRALLGKMPSGAYLVLNFDDEESRETKIDRREDIKTITFGFREGADFRAVEINQNGGTNFKINYQGSVVPFWLEKTIDREQIYAALAAVSVGTILGLNLVQMSEFLKEKDKKAI